MVFTKNFGKNKFAVLIKDIDFIFLLFNKNQSTLKRRKKMKWEKEMLRMLLYAQKNQIKIVTKDIQKIKSSRSINKSGFYLEQDLKKTIFFESIEILCPRVSSFVIESGVEFAIEYYQKQLAP